jgi:hypothetical protein
MNGRKCTGVTRIPAPVEGLAATHFTHHDAVGPMAQCRSQEIPDRHDEEASLLAPCLKSHRVGLGHLGVVCVLDQYNPILVGMNTAKAVSPADRDALRPNSGTDLGTGGLRATHRHGR